MKKLFTALLLFLSTAAFADDIHLKPSGALSYATGFNVDYILSPFDDTASLQASLNAGDFTSPAGHTYNVSATLTVTHHWEMNGSNVNTSMTSGSAVNLTSASASVSHGTFTGPWDYTTAANSTSGSIGMRTLAANCVIDNVHVTGYSSYGILLGAYPNPTVRNSLIEKTGYIGIYFDPEATIAGGTISNNTVDRSMISASTILDACIDIRASMTNALYSTTGWKIKGNTLIMPRSPHDPSNECLEVRYDIGDTIQNNTFIGGSIASSNVRSTNVFVKNNKCIGQSKEGIELADCQNCSTFHNSVDSSATDGILIDGSVGSNGVTLNGDTVKHTAVSSLHTYYRTDHLAINGCVFTLNAGNKMINLQQTNHVTLTNTNIDGNSVSGSSGILIDMSPGTLGVSGYNSPANITMSGGSITNCTNELYGFSGQLNQAVDSINFINVTATGTPTQKNQTFTNGAHWGPSVVFQTITLTFNALPTKTYGNADFPPGATSTFLITYTSDNTAVATIVAGNIHIVGYGSANITANNGYTTATQPLTVNKASLSITAGNASKTYGGTLTGGSGSSAFISSGLVLGQTVGSVTVAYGTGSAASANVGTYTGTVTPSAVTGGTFIAANYNISYAPGNIIVGRAPLTITADNKNKTAGLVNPALTASYTGFVLSQDHTILTTQPTITTTALTASPAGTYPITASGAAADNYSITYVPGTMAVTAVIVVTRGPVIRKGKVITKMH